MSSAASGLRLGVDIVQLRERARTSVPYNSRYFAGALDILGTTPTTD